MVGSSSNAKKKNLPLGGTTRLASALALTLALITLGDWAKVNGVDVMGGGTILTESRLRSLPDNHTWQSASSSYGASRCGPAGHHDLDGLSPLRIRRRLEQMRRIAPSRSGEGKQAAALLDSLGPSAKAGSACPCHTHSQGRHPYKAHKKYISPHHRASPRARNITLYLCQLMGTTHL